MPNLQAIHLRIFALLITCLCATISLSAAPASPRKPLIGINLELSDSGDRLNLGTDYIDAVTSAGGVPILLPPITDSHDIQRHIQLCDGFVFSGGKDMHPARYGQPPNADLHLLDPRREDYDFRLLKAALRSRKPILAICLGCQELNVLQGGTLVQDIPTFTSSTLDHHRGQDRHETVHTVDITTGSRLAEIVSTTTLAVNSSHHQSCDKPGKDITFTARSSDGIIEAYELKNYPFALAVQWHPEAILAYPGNLQLFQALVKQATRPARKR